MHLAGHRLDSMIVRAEGQLVGFGHGNLEVVHAEEVRRFERCMAIAVYTESFHTRFWIVVGLAVVSARSLATVLVGDTQNRQNLPANSCCLYFHK
jgi:hypothetical protein